MARSTADHSCSPPVPARQPWPELLEGVSEPVGTVWPCPSCGRTWVVYLSTSPVSSWAFRAWRREGRIARWRRERRERRGRRWRDLTEGI